MRKAVRFYSDAEEGGGNMSTVTIGAGHAHDEGGPGSHADGHAHHPFHAHHFDSMEQQFDSGKLGTWLFLVTEVLFFSGLFVAYIVYRAIHPEIFEWGHVYLNKWLGGLNTAVLIFSSLTMAWAVRAAQKGQKNLLVALLSITFLCAGAFLVVKYFEYTHKFHLGLYPQGWFNPVLDEHASDGHASAGQGSGEHGSGGHGSGEHGVMTPPPPNAGVFFSIYYCMTGLHAIHIIAGMGLIAWLTWRAAKGHFGPQYFGPVDYVGLYWHLVDLIWIYLFPLLYLIH